MRIAAEMSTVADPANQTQKRAKLVDAAQQFEASMLNEMLKPMQSGHSSWSGEDGGSDGGEDGGGDSSLDTIRSFGTEAVAKAISQAGGFGMARQVVAEIDRQHAEMSQARSSQNSTVEH